MRSVIWLKLYLILLSYFNNFVKNHWSQSLNKLCISIVKTSRFFCWKWKDHLFLIAHQKMPVCQYKLNRYHIFNVDVSLTFSFCDYDTSISSYTYNFNEIVIIVIYNEIVLIYNDVEQKLDHSDLFADHESACSANWVFLSKFCCNGSQVWFGGKCLF